MRERRATRRPQCGLIADDVDDARELWKLWLTIWGFMPVEARNGRDALTKAADLSPSVILMDLWMPVLDGHGRDSAAEAEPRHGAHPGDCPDC
jgi:CheY-like chemotaxis protein